MVNTKKYDDMSRTELEAESVRLAKQRTEVREAQVEVDGLLDAYRALEQANLSPETIKQLYRISKLQSSGSSSSEVTQ